MNATNDRNTQPNSFDAETADRLYQYLTPDQKAIAELRVINPANHGLILSLPQDRKELTALAVMLSESLVLRDKSWAVPMIEFKTVWQKHQGIFTIPNYNKHRGYYTTASGEYKSYWCEYLTEDLKECPQYQTLTQDLTDLIDWMVD